MTARVGSPTELKLSIGVTLVSLGTSEAQERGDKLIERLDQAPKVPPNDPVTLARFQGLLAKKTRRTLTYSAGG